MDGNENDEHVKHIDSDDKESDTDEEFVDALESFEKNETAEEGSCQIKPDDKKKSFDSTHNTSALQETNIDSGETTYDGTEQFTDDAIKESTITTTEGLPVGKKNKNSEVKRKPIRPPKPYVRVIFEVLVSKKLLVNGHDVVIIIYESTESFVYRMTHRGQNEKKEMYTFDMKTERHELERRLTYNYAIYNRHNSTYDYEDYCSHMGANTRRMTCFTKEAVDTWYQYDGVAKKDKTFTWRSPTTYKNAFGPTYEYLRRKARQTADAFCPSWFKTEFSEQNCSLNSFQEDVNKFHSLMTCLIKVYCSDNRAWNVKVELKSDIVLYLFENVLKEQPYEDKSSRIIQALAMIHVVVMERINLKEKHRRQLCKSLLPNFAQHGKHEKSGLVKVLKFMESNDITHNLKKYVQTFVMNDPSWLYCMPLIHLSMKLCAPFDTTPNDYGYNNSIPTWWGIEMISEQNVSLQGATRWTIGMVEILDELKTYFTIDFFLPRTFAACLKPNQLEKAFTTTFLPVEVCCATLQYWCRVHLPSGSQSSHAAVLKEAEFISKALSSVEERIDRCLDAVDGYSCPSSISLDMAVVIAEDGFKLCLDRSVIGAILQWSRIFLKCMALRSNKISQQKVEETAQLVCEWLERSTKERAAALVKIWNMAFYDKRLQTEYRSKWNDEMSLRFKNFFNQMRKDSKFEKELIDVFCKDDSDLKDEVKECLTTVVCEATIEKQTKDSETVQLFHRTEFVNKMTTMFDTKWELMVNRASLENRCYAILTMMLQWPPILLFLEHKAFVENSPFLQGRVLKRITESIAVARQEYLNLLKGNVQIVVLRQIAARSDVFANIIDSVEKMDEAKSIIGLIKKRQSQFEAYQKTADEIAVLLDFSASFSGAVRQFSQVLKQDTEYKFLDELCDVESTIAETSVTAFDEIHLVKPMLSELMKVKQSRIFRLLWNNQNTDNIATLQDIHDKIWAPAFKRFEDIQKKLSSGDLKLKELEDIIFQFRDKNEIISSEFQALGLPNETIQCRLKQLRQYRYVQKCVRGAALLLDIQHAFNLTGDFSSFEGIVDRPDDLTLNAFDQDLMRACKIIDNIDRSKMRCLEVFSLSKPIVDWLNETMGENGKDLTAFIDLTMIHVGDDPLGIDKVKFFHSAVNGYHPLIFGLSSTTNGKQLLEKCTLVWKEMEVNPHLPDRLKSSLDQIQWLQDMQNRHTSVEITAFHQAEAINKRGVFVIHAEHFDSSITVSDVLKLTTFQQVNENTDEKRYQQTDYTYSDLKDLQSRLSLVVGRNDQPTTGVHNFLQILNSLVRLTNVYLQLCNDGCSLYYNWTATFHCDANLEGTVCSTLEFGGGQENIHLEGLRENGDEVLEMINIISEFMEDCLENWNKYIRHMRSNYRFLNYFTIQQLAILQTELVRVATGEEPEGHMYPLLSAVKPNCNYDQVNEALNASKDDVSIKYAIQDIANIGRQGSSKEKKSKIERRRNLINKITKSGYSIEVATRYVKAYPDSEAAILEVLDWCAENSFMDNEDDTSLSLSSTLKKRLQDAGIENGNGSEPLRRNLDLLWKCFQESIKLQISDFFSIEHVGIFLKHLQKDTSNIHRQMPKAYSVGEPNIILCKSDEMILTALSIYQTTQQQPLPQSDEVLLCSSRTKVEEVDLFWRRALFEKGTKIYCLVNVGDLLYDVSEEVARLLDEYLSQTGEVNYRLFVICAVEKEQRSVLMASLYKYTKQPLRLNEQLVSTYLKQHLTCPSEEHFCAASIDCERSSVRAVLSNQASVGKTLFIKRKSEKFESLAIERNECFKQCLKISIQEKSVDLDNVCSRLIANSTDPSNKFSRIIHLDISHVVKFGVDDLLFNLIVLKCLTTKRGLVWRRSDADLLMIETMPSSNRKTDDHRSYSGVMFNLLPAVLCRTPTECLSIYKSCSEGNGSVVFDEELFKTDVFQRPFQYLLYLDEKITLSEIDPEVPKGTPQECLTTLLRYCGIQEPLWSELHHFVQFLNTQLEMFERNAFVSSAAESDLPGFRSFVLRFLLQMSRDFSNRTLNIIDESSGSDTDMTITDDIPNEYTIRNKWESSPHPYLFFNSDESTFTFLGFYIENRRHLVDLQTGQVLEENIMKTSLYYALITNQVNLQEDFDKLGRLEKIMKLCNVMGIKTVHDPDPTYELTTDNVKKILAIHMRFRCDIPVIIMGETGCGKTRLIQFMCAMQRTPESEVKNMLIMKVHGGTTGLDIRISVAKATHMAKENIKHGSHIYTVLFFDEANTTECVGLFKELLCDKTLQGETVDFSNNLKIVAACNPYRKHTDDVVKNLESAGLGYHVGSNETTDRFGNVPMRRLVYRVQPLPRSLLPLVWDFGQLSTDVEELYIKQMVKTKIQAGSIPKDTELPTSLSKLLAKSQEFMREQKGECSFVSLRDVERVLNAVVWFYNSKFSRKLFISMDEILCVPTINEADSDNTRYETVDSHDLSISQTSPIDDEESESNTDHEIESFRRNSVDSVNSFTTTDSAQGEDERNIEDIDSDSEMKEGREMKTQPNRIMRSTILALGLCYHASLKNRLEYRKMIAQFLASHFNLAFAEDQMLKEIESCQEVFLNNVSLDKNIARNSALRENVFMMAICIELRIPLFLVGKPGSSKSLAKTIVSDAMKGIHSDRKLFKKLKQTQMVSFQCSPLATSDGIVRTFRQCSQFQQENNLDTFVATVILDEVGLAEDSPRMPLKVLHPLLENGCIGEESPEKYMKVAFIGISNWALDPAKMNRGILVQRDVPDLQEIELSAEGICEDEKGIVKDILKRFFKPLAESYVDIFDQAVMDRREFFGLRDFFCMIKMLYNFVDKSRRNPTMAQVLHCIKRNFGGLKYVNSETTFRKYLHNLTSDDDTPEHAPDCSDSGLIDASIFDTFRSSSESRYPLLMTESFGTLTILQQKIEISGHDIKPVIIFGSSFRGDQEYTQICRNINQIKVCMETGKMVVLLNMENLYESLYDALNQYYMYYGENRYVDLGLGYHRVKCQVHPQFRLIVVAETETVYRSFPIPLINRLEKHFLSSDTLLTERQKTCAKRLRDWAFRFASETETLPVTAQTYNEEEKQKRNLSSCFVGYRDDACSAIMVNICRGENHDDEQCQQRGIQVLIQIATPESVIRQEKHFPEIKKWYFDEQHHHNVFAYMQHRLSSNNDSFDQVTTHSKLFSGTKQAENISGLLGVKEEEVLFINSLYSLETEQQFADKIRLHLQLQHLDTKLIVVQCDSGDMNQSLIDCARFCITREFQMLGEEHLQAKLHVFFIVQLPRTNGGCFSGFQCGAWSSVHIDDIHFSREMPAVHQMIGKSVMDIFMEPLDKDQKVSENINSCDVLKSKKVEIGNIKGIIVKSVTTAMSMVKEMDKVTHPV